MPTRMLARRTASLTLILFLLYAAVGCDLLTDDSASDGASAVRPAGTPAAGDFRISFKQTGSGLVFEAHGAVEDAGHVIDSPDAVAIDATGTRAGSWSGTRVLVGAHGTIVLQYTGTRITDRPLEAEGNFEIMQGTRAYAGLHGTGRFYLSADDFGVVIEQFQGSLHIDEAIDPAFDSDTERPSPGRPDRERRSIAIDPFAG